MPTKKGRRFQEKKLRYHLRLAYSNNQDPFPLIQKLTNLEADRALSKQIPYVTRELTLDHNYPDYRNIRKGDARRVVYKLRELFGLNRKEMEIPSSYRVLPPIQEF
ncbi:hypothetical protein X777_16836 [Ooceraea biroi]|uniref:Uncharacterized protein n=1 Tax=Ooceraea biroi TaxID=2015173 RepID=A0A026WS73_OOCBI|nr:hypothetical protein X777_16836 [Ooceraea biroi]